MLAMTSSTLFQAISRKRYESHLVNLPQTAHRCGGRNAPVNRAGEVDKICCGDR